MDFAHPCTAFPSVCYDTVSYPPIAIASWFVAFALCAMRTPANSASAAKRFLNLFD